LILEALQKIYDAKKSVEVSKDISPCIKNIMMMLQTGEEVREELAIEEMYSAVQPYVKMAAYGLQRKLRVLKRARGL